MMDLNGPGAGSSTAKMGIEEELPYKVLTTEQIVQDMIECIDEVNAVVEIPPTTTRILLHHFKWDKEKLYERYYAGRQKRLYTEAHIIKPLKKPTTSKTRKNSKGCDDVEECEICLREVPISVMTSLACGHRFCSDCWTEYLTTKIMEEGMCQTISCARHGCGIYVDDQTVMSLISDPQVKVTYQHLITNSFVECNRLLRWCPQPACTNAVKVKISEPQSISCSCGHTFCFVCGENWHDPINCQMFKEWQKKREDDLKTANWIAANTKECPKCKVKIEKNGGCNHMSCKTCKANFCWFCLGLFGNYLHHCNRYAQKEATAARQEQKRSIVESLQRYLFCYDRYMNHAQSLKFEQNLYASVMHKMEEMHNVTLDEVKFLIKAVDVLCQCRQTLMYTYVFVYYVKKSNQSVIFEDNQQDLESATEQLSGYFETDITQNNLLDMKQMVHDKYRYCESRRNVLLEHVREGYGMKKTCAQPCFVSNEYIVLSLKTELLDLTKKHVYAKHFSKNILVSF